MAGEETTSCLGKPKQHKEARKAFIPHIKATHLDSTGEMSRVVKSWENIPRALKSPIRQI